MYMSCFCKQRMFCSLNKTTMVKRRRKISFSLYPKRFFKVFLPHQSSHHMKLPSAFLKYINSTAAFKYTIVSPTKCSWPVHIKMVDNNLYIQQGWEQFVQHNSLEFGDFLVFSYDGNTIFYVKIYGRNGCEKESTYHSEEGCRVLSLLEEKTLEKRNSIVLDHGAISERFEGNKDFTEASLFESDFPFFKVDMQPSYVDRTSVNIPKSFSERHMSHMTSDKKGITLVYSDKSWLVKVNGHTENTVRKLSGGWPNFSKDNSLKTGDICAFELVDRKNDVFKVSIFRC